jgi:hypothetical protein
LKDSDYGDYDDRSGAEQYVETEYTCYDW